MMKNNLSKSICERIAKELLIAGYEDAANYLKGSFLQNKVIETIKQHTSDPVAIQIYNPLTKEWSPRTYEFSLARRDRYLSEGWTIRYLYPIAEPIKSQTPFYTHPQDEGGTL